MTPDTREHTGVLTLETPDISFEDFLNEGDGYGPIFPLHLHSITLIWGKAGRKEVSILLVRL